MKKLFTTLLVLVILMASMSTRINAQETPEDQSYLTIELIENSFWETLESCDYPQATKEDEYLTWLIEGIREPNTIPAFGYYPFINLGIGGFINEDFDFDRFTDKCRKVIELYNHTHDLQLTMKSETISSNTFVITVKSEDPDFIENMVTLSGQLAHVKEETIYWETSRHFGSGRSGKFEKTRVVQVNGVAYLDENGEVLSFFYGTTPRNIEIWAKRMLHICTEEGEDLGWVYPTQLTCIDE